MSHRQHQHKQPPLSPLLIPQPPPSGLQSTNPRRISKPVFDRFLQQSVDVRNKENFTDLPRVPAQPNKIHTLANNDKSQVEISAAAAAAAAGQQIPQSSRLHSSYSTLPSYRSSESQQSIRQYILDSERQKEQYYIQRLSNSSSSLLQLVTPNIANSCSESAKLSYENSQLLSNESQHKLSMKLCIHSAKQRILNLSESLTNVITECMQSSLSQIDSQERAFEQLYDQLKVRAATLKSSLISHPATKSQIIDIDSIGKQIMRFIHMRDDLAQMSTESFTLEVQQGISKRTNGITAMKFDQMASCMTREEDRQSEQQLITEQDQPETFRMQDADGNAATADEDQQNHTCSIHFTMSQMSCDDAINKDDIGQSSNIDDIHPTLLNQSYDISRSPVGRQGSSSDQQTSSDGCKDDISVCTMLRQNYQKRMMECDDSDECKSVLSNNTQRRSSRPRRFSRGSSSLRLIGTESDNICIEREQTLLQQDDFNMQVTVDTSIKSQDIQGQQIDQQQQQQQKQTQKHGKSNIDLPLQRPSAKGWEKFTTVSWGEYLLEGNAVELSQPMTRELLKDNRGQANGEQMRITCCVQAGDNLFAFGTATGELLLYTLDPLTIHPISSFNSPLKNISQLILANPSLLILASSTSSNLIKFSLQSREFLPSQQLNLHLSPISSVCVNQGNRQSILVSCSADGCMNVWEDLALHSKKQHKNAIKLCSFNADGSNLYCIDAINQIIVYSITSNTQNRTTLSEVKLQKIIKSAQNITTICSSFTHQNYLLACGGEDGIVRLFDTRVDNVIKVIKASKSAVRSILSLNSPIEISNSADQLYGLLIGSEEDDDLVAFSSRKTSKTDVFSTMGKLRANQMVNSLEFIREIKGEPNNLAIQREQKQIFTIDQTTATLTVWNLKRIN